jgi:hypothetical protein
MDTKVLPHLMQGAVGKVQLVRNILRNYSGDYERDNPSLGMVVGPELYKLNRSEVHFNSPAHVVVNI